MHLFEWIHSEVIIAIEALQGEGALPEELKSSNVAVESPKDPSHGDMATNAAMVLAKQAHMKPRDLAELLQKKLSCVEGVAEVSVAGPGFINLRLEPSKYLETIHTILQAGTSYGDSTLGNGRKMNVEYVSANPTGPLHIGHARGAVYGDALAAVLTKAGYKVTKEYYINDAGGQIGVLAQSAYLRYREACGEMIEIPEGLYPGEYLKPVGQAIKEQYGDALLTSPTGRVQNGETILGEGDEEKVRDIAIDQMMQLIKDDLAAMGVAHDVFVSEKKELHDKGGIEKAIELLEGKGLMYRGVLEPPKGKKPDDWEEREQLLFKSSEFGDDSDRALQKPDGSYTYFAADLAYSLHKITRGFNALIYMLGADHGGYKKRMEAANNALSDGKVKTDIKLCQLVHLFRNGEPVKMSKRAGNFETVRDVVDAVGKDILRFVMLTRKNDMVMEFDLEKVKEQSKDNPVFYVQYAHARAKSLLRLAEEQMPDALKASEQPLSEVLALLSTEAEMNVIQKMAEFPRIVEAAASHAEPHRIAYYVQELAADFHGLWNTGNKDEDLRFIVEGEAELTTARLALARAVATVVASGLEVLGVEPKDAL